MERRKEEKDQARRRAFAARVLELREAQDLTQEELAHRANLHRAEIGFVERAERFVGINVAWRIADGLGMSLDALVKGLD